MADMIYDFSKNLGNNPMLTNMVGGVTDIVHRKRAEEAERVKSEAYGAAMDAYVTDKTPENLKAVYESYPEKFAETQKMFADMGTLERQNVAQSNSEIIGAIASGNPDIAINKLQTMAEAYRNSGDPEDADDVQMLEGFIEQIENGDVDGVRDYLSFIMGGFKEGQDALTALQGITKAKSEGMKTDADVAKTMASIEGLSKTERNRLGVALHKLPSGMGDALADLLVVRETVGAGGMDSNDVFKAEQALRKERDTYVKPYQTVLDSSKTMEHMLGDPNVTSGAMDYAAIRVFNKALDPGSVVRESEAASTAEAQSLLDRVFAATKNIKDGEKIGAQLRADMLAATKILAKGAKERIKKQDDRIMKTVEGFGLGADRIFFGESPTADSSAVNKLDDLRAFIRKRNPNSTGKIEEMTEEELKSAYGNTYKAYTPSNGEVVEVDW